MREAVATGRVLVSAAVVDLLRGDGVPKGDALGVARVAGIMAAKRTPDLVPLCHPLAISGVTVDLAVADDAVEITATVRTTDRTGVEMEALTAVSRRGPHGRRHGQGRRQGGRHHRRAGRVEVRRQVRRLGPAVTDGPPLTATVVCASNRASAGVYEDTTGPVIVDALASSASRSRARSSYPTGSRSATRSAPRSTTGRGSVITTGGTGPDADRPHPRGHPGAARLRGPRHRRGDPGVRRRAGRRRPPPLSRGLAGVVGTDPRGQPAGLARRREGRPRRRSMPLLVHAVQQIAGSDH